jgi:hypothetical protein
MGAAVIRRIRWYFTQRALIRELRKEWREQDWLA